MTARLRIAVTRRIPGGRVRLGGLLAAIVVGLLLGLPGADAAGAMAPSGAATVEPAAVSGAAATPEAAPEAAPEPGPEGRSNEPPPARVAYEIIFLGVAGLLTAIVLIAFLIVFWMASREGRGGGTSPTGSAPDEEIGRN